MTLYAGVAWDATGWAVEVLDADGRRAAPARNFGVADTGVMIAFLRDLGAPTTAVVDSTNGMLDGHLAAAGLDVYRADPPVLPPRPVLGSVPAADLAGAAVRDLSLLTRLRRDHGTLTGRTEENAAGMRASAPQMEALTAAGRCLDSGPRDRPDVALTFDDGPNPPYTGRILDTLARYAVPATFFCIGLNATAYPDEVARTAEERHALGNHTWSHPFLPELTRAEFTAQVERTGEAMATAGGVAAPALFRPPYGSRSPDVARWFGEMDPSVVLWDVDPGDWAMPGADAIARTVLDQTRPGSVILMHDGGGDRFQTAEALPAIIEGLLGRGYRFVRADELVPATGRPADTGP